MRDRRHAGVRAPGQKLCDGAAVGAPRVWVADIGGEEFEEAQLRALAGGGDEGRSGVSGEGDELIHFFLQKWRAMYGGITLMAIGSSLFSSASCWATVASSLRTLVVLTDLMK
jgi:hypothetical protein